MSVQTLDNEPLFNNQSFASFLKEAQFVQCTVAADAQNRRVIHLAARSSEICTIGVNVSCPLPDFMVWIQTPWKLMRYGETGHFKQHFDRSTHVELPNGPVETNCTVLLFPPARYSPFEGGDLSLHGQHEFYTIVPSTFEKWTLVIFLHKTLHTCATITKGTRYVLKTSAYIPDFPDEISSAFSKEGYALD